MAQAAHKPSDVPESAQQALLAALCEQLLR